MSSVAKKSGSVADDVVSSMTMVDDYKGSVVFGGETAGYQNAVGMYTIGADGSISNVRIVFSNASLKGSGGDLLAGKSAVDVSLEAGAKVGFFVVPNGFSQPGMAKVLADTAGSFKFVNADGSAGNINSGAEMKLVHTSASGAETTVKSAYGTSTFHSVDTGSMGLNGDKLDHVKTTVDPDAGTVRIAFEDLKGGGDNDFDDSIIVVNVGASNAAALKAGTAEAIVAERAAAAEALTAESASSGPTEMLIDGSFEQGIVGANSWSHQKTVGGWKSDSEIEVWGKGFYGLKAADGDKIAELDYNTKASNIFQDVSTEAGTEYTFSFDFMKRPDSKAGSDTIHVFWNGELVGTVEPSKSEWTKAAFKVVGTGGSDRIEFREDSADNDSYGGLIDRASLMRSGPTAAERAHQAAKAAEEKAKAEAEEKARLEAEAKAKAEAEEKARLEAEAKAKAEAEEKARLEAEAKAKAEAEEKARLEAEKNKDALLLKTSDVHDVKTGEHLEGNRDKNAIDGGAGEDEMFGRSGDDVLNGDGVARVTIPLDIAVRLVDADGSERLSILVDNMPEGAVLSAGKDNGDGSWTLSSDDLVGLTLTGPDSANFSLKVVATTHGASNLTEASEINVSLVRGNNDLMMGNGGNDKLDGGAGDDVMYGGTKPTGEVKPHASTVADNDVLHGGAGNDVMYGNAGDDEMFGEADNDTMSGGKGNDLVDGGDGDDVLTGNSGDDVVIGGAGNDVMKGNAGNDTLVDGEGDDVVEGSAGDDVVRAGAGNDSYNGGSGFDTLDFSAADRGMMIDLSKKSIVGMGEDKVANFEVVVGSSHDDVMKGSKAAETLDGGAGDDDLRGLGGADVLTGGEGSDTFRWSLTDVMADGKHLGVDRVTDFSKEDVLDLSRTVDGSFASVDDAVLVKDDGSASHVYARVAGEWVEVVVLEGVSGMTAGDMHKSGMLVL
ncbi:MAG TPA: cell envelope integrity protein TolA [Hyphomicrobiaceae bacterium]|nr:cell envelope integrity protein TolA [Hyphomicrobiaceae bacterium]